MDARMHSNSHIQPSIHFIHTCKGRSKSKDKVQPTTGHESPEGVEDYFYSFFNLGATWGGWKTPRPGRLTLGTYSVLIV